MFYANNLYALRDFPDYFLGTVSAVQAVEVRIPNHKSRIVVGISEDVDLGVRHAAERISTFYGYLPARLGVYLTNPNVVLLMAGERGLADVVFRNWKSEDAESIRKFNVTAMKSGFRISYKESEAQNGREVDGWIENLAGYEKVSNQTSLPGVLKYEASNQWQGLAEWKVKTLENMVKHCAPNGPYPEEYKALDAHTEAWLESNLAMTSVLNGIAFGYPDTVLLPGNGKWITTAISYADYHLGNEPNYLYHEGEDLRAVNQNTKRIGTLLGEYYHCPQYTTLSRNADFAKYRAIADNFGRE